MSQKVVCACFIDRRHKDQYNILFLVLALATFFFTFNTTVYCILGSLCGTFLNFK